MYVVIDRQRYRIEVELINEGPALELYRLSASGKEVILQSNRPVLRAKGLKKKKNDRKVIEGRILHPRSLQKVILELEKVINE